MGNSTSKMLRNMSGHKNVQSTNAVMGIETDLSHLNHYPDMKQHDVSWDAPQLKPSVKPPTPQFENVLTKILGSSFSDSDDLTPMDK